MHLRAPHFGGWRALVSAGMLAGVLFCGCILGTSSSVWALPPISTIVLSGMQAPGLPSGVTLQSFSAFAPLAYGPTIGSQGDVAFYAGVSAPNTQGPNTGLWTWQGNQLSLVGFPNDHAEPFARGVNYKSVSGSQSVETQLNSAIVGPLPIFDAAGDIAFSGYVSGLGITTSSDEMIWKGGPGQLGIVAQEGSLTAGTSDGSKYSSAGHDFAFASYAMNDSGQIAFQAATATPGNSLADFGIWAGAAGSVVPVARSGSATPGITGGTFASLPNVVYYTPFSGPALNANGQVVFVASYNLPASNPHAGIWAGGPGSLALIAKFGDHAPGTADGVTFADAVSSTPTFGFTRPDISASGQVAFGGVLNGPGVTSSNYTGIWAGGAGDLALVARAGDHAPGTPTEVTFATINVTPTSINTHILMNGSGQIAFATSLTGSGVNSTNDYGLWTGTPGNLTLVGRFSQPPAFAINNAGQVAYSTTSGIWLSNSLGNSLPIVSVGETINTGPGVSHSITSVLFTGGSTADGLGSGFNDAGEITFVAQLSDNSTGVFVADTSTVVVPEPGSLWLATAAVALLISRFRVVRRRGIVALLLVIAMFIATDALAATPVATIAISGTHAPEVPSGITFSNFIPVQPLTINAGPVPPTINSLGQVTFYGLLTGIGAASADNIGIWTGTPGNVALAALAGDNAGGIGAGVNFIGFTSVANSSFPILPVPVPTNAAGQIGFAATISGVTINPFNDEGIWSGSAHTPTVVVRENDTAPGISPSATFNNGQTFTFQPPLYNDAGNVGIEAALSSGGIGIWTGASGSLQLLVKTGQAAPGAIPGATFTSFIPEALNASDQMAVLAQVSGGSYGIWAGSAGTLGHIALAGDIAPGQPPSARFTGLLNSNPFSSPDMNGHGTVIFAATTQMGSSGLWASESSGLHLLVADGQPAPGMPAGVTFGNLGFVSSGPPLQLPLVNDEGDVAFNANMIGPGITGATRAGIWVGQPGNYHLVAQLGTQAPGAPPDTTYGNFYSAVPSNGYPSLALNSQGQVAFIASVNDGTLGIWGTDRGGNLREVVRAHDVLQLAPGDLRTVISLAFLGGSGNADGRPSGFSDNSDVTFWARFSDGTTGIFVSDALAVPEPGAAVLSGIGVTLSLAAAARRRPRGA